MALGKLPRCKKCGSVFTSDELVKHEKSCKGPTQAKKARPIRPVGPVSEKPSAKILPFRKKKKSDE